MGCDIHMNLENRFSETSTHYFNLAQDLDVDRSYNLFSYLANVRNYGDVTPIADPRGLPEGICYETKEHYEDWKSDAHSMSWLHFSELASLPADYKEWPFYKAAEAYAERYGENNVRFVFWFDN